MVVAGRWMFALSLTRVARGLADWLWYWMGDISADESKFFYALDLDGSSSVFVWRHVVRNYVSC